MKKLLILGGGMAGTLMANKLSKELDGRTWSVTVVDQDDVHYYQPGYVFIPFGTYTEKDVVAPKQRFMPHNVDLIISPIESIDPGKRTVSLAHGRKLDYDLLVIATGSEIRPGETDGLAEAMQHNAHDFYTLEGATRLASVLERFEGGKMVVSVTEMPIKCPVAPLEFAFLADSYFRERGIRNKVDIEYVTPLPGAFTKPVASHMLSDLLESRGIALTAEFDTGEVDGDRGKVMSYDGKEVDYDLLVTVPTVMGSELIERSGMGDELAFVPTDPRTLQHREYEDIFVIGDATDLPTSKAGSVAHFEGDILIENIKHHIAGEPLDPAFDGHANCFVESGGGKAMLIDFNYDVEPLPGTFPVPGVGPFALLRETRTNHWGKLGFKWIYWNILLKGRPLPIPTRMSLAGKRTDMLQTVS